MGIETLARLLEETAADVPAPAMAEVAWHRARRIRHRRRVVAGIATAAVVCGVAVGTAIAVGAAPWAAPPPVGSTPTVTQTASPPAVDRLPAALPTRDGAPLPRTFDLRPSGVKGITASPLSRTVALYQQEPGQTEKLPAITALGTGNERRWIDDAITLQFTRDAAGRLVTPLMPTSLSPDGRRAAFGQHDSLIVVDLTAGKADAIKLPGWYWYVLWIGDAKVLVGQANATYLVDIKTGSSRRVSGAFRLPDVAVDPTGRAPLVELPSDAEQLSLRQWSSVDDASPSEIQIDQSRLGGYRVKGWSGPGWRAGDLVVRAGGGIRPDQTGAELVAVVDTRTGAVVRLLDTLATPLGWLDDHTVLLQASRGIVTWDIRNGQVTSVSRPFDGTVAIRPR